MDLNKMTQTQTQTNHRQQRMEMLDMPWQSHLRLD